MGGERAAMVKKYENEISRLQNTVDKLYDERERQKTNRTQPKAADRKMMLDLCRKIKYVGFASWCVWVEAIFSAECAHIAKRVPGGKQTIRNRKINPGSCSPTTSPCAGSACGTIIWAFFLASARFCCARRFFASLFLFRG